MEFGILGPLEVRRDGEALALGGVKQRSLLAILLLHANEVVGSERLIDAVWGEQPPGTAATALHGYVSQLRKTLEPDGAPYSVLVTHPPGYVLRVEPDRFDLPRFQQLVGEAEAADPEPAAALLRDALALWRGPALADLAYELFAQPEVARLEELRLAALEDRIEAELALGRHADLVPELEQLVGGHPLRERLRGQLILGLYRCGRQAEALEAYQETRRTLVDELGIDPGRSLQELERAILRQDPALELVQKAPPRRRTAAAAGRRAAGAFVGRERELRLLQAGLEDALAGRGRLFLLAGEPGIGKSRLADELASGAKQRGARVLWGRCWEAGGAPPYWPWVQGIRTYLRETDHERLRTYLGTAAVDMAQMLPELRELFPDLPEAPALEPEAARFQLFDATTSFLERAADTQPLVIVLDDLHAADTPSLLMLEFLAAELAVARILLIGTYRDTELGIDHPLSDTLVQLGRQASERIHLSGLDLPDVTRYIELTTDTVAPESLVAAIHERTDGNPLFVEEVVRLLAAEGALDGGSTTLARPLVPPSVRDAIGQRLRKLSDDCNRALGLASVLGREFDLDALEQLSGVPRRDLLGLLDEAVVARLVSEVPGAPGRLRFAHALIRDSVYESLTPARRIEAHREAGETLEARHAGDLDPVLAELAHHFVQAGQGGEAGKAVDYARRAGDRALQLLAYEEAARLYELGLTALELRRPADDRVRCELLLALGDARARGGDGPRSREAFLGAAELADRLGLPEQLGQAALGYGGRFIFNVARGDKHLQPLLERALDAVGENESPLLRARLLARLAGGPLRDSTDPTRRRRLSEEAVELARSIDDRATLAYALEGLYLATEGPGDERLLAIATDLLRTGEEVDDNERVCAGHIYRFDELFEYGDIRAAKRELRAVAALAGELRQPAQLWYAAALQAFLALFEGRFADADEAIHAAFGLGSRAESWYASVSFHLQLYLLARELRQLDELTERYDFERLDADFAVYPPWRCMRAQLDAELTRPEDARERIEQLAEDGFSGIPFNKEWIFGLCLLAEPVRALRAVEWGARLYELLRPYGAHQAFGKPEIAVGVVDRYLGILADLLDRPDDAEEHFERALTLNGAVGGRPWVAHTQRDLAELLLRRDGAGDRDRAIELLAAAAATADELGMTSLAGKAAALR